MFATDDINNATLLSIEPVKDDIRGDKLKFSIPAMGGTKEIVMSTYDMTYCETPDGKMVRRTNLVVGQTYNLEVYSYVFRRLKL